MSQEAKKEAAFQKWQVIKVENAEVGQIVRDLVRSEKATSDLLRTIQSYGGSRKRFPGAKDNYQGRSSSGMGCSEQHTVVEGRGLLVCELDHENFPECLQVRG